MPYNSMPMDAMASPAGISGAVLLFGLLAALITGFAYGIWRRSWPVLVATAAGGGLLQVGHFTEHIAQQGYWFTHTQSPPWFSPWATSMQAGIADLVGRDGDMTAGMEIMHLVGNLWLFIGFLAAVIALRRSSRAGRWARAGAVVQGIHVLEHASLTVSYLAAGTSAGASTGFGTIDAGPALWTYRVWWHFLVNLAVTWVAVMAAIRWRQRRVLETPASHERSAVV